LDHVLDDLEVHRNDQWFRTIFRPIALNKFSTPKDKSGHLQKDTLGDALLLLFSLFSCNDSMITLLGVWSISNLCSSVDDDDLTTSGIFEPLEEIDNFDWYVFLFEHLAVSNVV
jgi:hypothetical protein